jgi:type IV secretory pathway VirB10-like protein
MADERKKSNRLLLGLVFVSAGAHALGLFHLGTFYRPCAMSYIELEMRTEEDPRARSTPVPPKGRKAMLRRKEPAIKPAQSANVAEPSAPPVSPPPEPVFSSVVEPVEAPPSEFSESDRPKSSDCESSADRSPPTEEAETTAAAKEPAAGEKSDAESIGGLLQPGAEADRKPEAVSS